MRTERIHGQTPPMEEARYSRPVELPGVELLSATFRRQNFARHYHECYALGVIEQGGLRFDYLGKEHLAPAGSVNLVEPGEVHNGDAGGGTGWSYRMLYIAPHLVEDAARQAGIRGVTPHFPKGVLFDPVLAGQVRGLHLTLENGRVSGLELDSRLVGALTRWISLHAEKGGTPPLSGHEPRAVRLAREYIDARFHEDIRLHDLAQHSGLSPFHLVRVFGRSVGLPPARYQMLRRVQYAKRQLPRPLSLAEIAIQAGFADQSHLTREFKRILGVPPGKYRKMLQEG